MGRQPRLPELFHLRGLHWNGMRVRLFSDGQIWQDMPSPQPRAILEDGPTELGEGNGTLNMKVIQIQTSRVSTFNSLSNATEQDECFPPHHTQSREP